MVCILFVVSYAILLDFYKVIIFTFEIKLQKKIEKLEKTKK